MAFSAPAGTIPARGFRWDQVQFPYRQVSDFADLVYGKSLPAAQRQPGDIPVYGTNGRTGWHNAHLTEGPGVILGRKGQGHLGVKWCPSPFWVIDTAYFASIDESLVDLRWFYYITKYVGLDHLKSGPKPGLSRDTFGRQLFPFPERAEQQAIAAFLGRMDEKIELNRRMNETLEATARSIFRSWFVDFDPVVAKAEGRQPAHMSADTAALFPDRFVETEEGPIPDGWSIRPLPDVIEINPTRRLAKGEAAPYLEMSNMPKEGPQPLDWYDRPFGSGVRFQNGDVLLARITPCLEHGKTAFVDFLTEGEVGWGSTEYIVMRSKPPLSLAHAYFLARDDDLRSFAIAQMTGSSGRQRVPHDSFEHFLVTVPPEPLAARFGQLATGVLTKIKANSEQSRTLATIRDTLLPRLLSGEIRLGEAEAVLEGVA